ncbi:zinc-dependent alcohol dehydrogenase family protein [Salinisphaera orenii]|uniref:zinc-dependent alcohol dehydrogenase family protein n=1 Tax=Salinisphaera orenii TaxID=856731 RepID=UPI003A4C70C8
MTKTPRNNLVLRYRSFGPPTEQLVLERSELANTPERKLRVAMSAAPVNPSDLIPVSGAYAHRIKLPAVAGYEGVGVVVDASPAYVHLIGRRVLPLRGAGTWQCFVDCDPSLAIPVPDDIDDCTAARSYINPMATLRMLNTWPVRGKRVLLTGAGSSCANLLGLWAKRQGAAEVIGVYRSHQRQEQLKEIGIKPLPITDRSAIEHAAAQVDITFDALGGTLAASILESMGYGRIFVAYGLLTGRAIMPSMRPAARYHRFHLRDELKIMTAGVWQQQFLMLWPWLRESVLPETKMFSLRNWSQAYAQARLMVPWASFKFGNVSFSLVFELFNPSVKTS